MRTSGTTAKATTDNTAIELLAAGAAKDEYALIENAGLVAGWVSFNGGADWVHLPAGTASGPATICIPGLRRVNAALSGGSLAVQAKRIADGSNLSGLWAASW